MKGIRIWMLEAKRDGDKEWGSTSEVFGSKRKAMERLRETVSETGKLNFSFRVRRWAPDEIGTRGKRRKAPR